MVGELAASGLTSRRAVLAGHNFHGLWYRSADIVPPGATSKSKKKKNKKKGGSKEENKVEESVQVNGNHDKVEAEHDDDADEEEEQIVRELDLTTQQWAQLTRRL